MWNCTYPMSPALDPNKSKEINNRWYNSFQLLKIRMLDMQN